MMNLLQLFRRYFITAFLAAFLVIVTVFSFDSSDSWATIPVRDLLNQPHLQLASINRDQATLKNLEGKTQEAIGKISGDRKDQIIGKAKQAESKVRNAAEDVSDMGTNLMENLKEAGQNVKKGLS